jgi:hypothetical protein
MPMSVCALYAMYAMYAMLDSECDQLVLVFDGCQMSSPRGQHLRAQHLKTTLRCASVV